MSEEQVCCYCGATASKTIRLEKHHVLGRINSDLCVYACMNCHKKPTTKQNSLPRWVRSKSAPEIVQKAFGLISLSEHFNVLREEMDKIGNEIIEWYEENGHRIHKRTPREDKRK